jgi:hypothetical protein
MEVRIDLAWWALAVVWAAVALCGCQGPSPAQKAEMQKARRWLAANPLAVEAQKPQMQFPTIHFVGYTHYSPFFYESVSGQLMDTEAPHDANKNSQYITLIENILSMTNTHLSQSNYVAILTSLATTNRIIMIDEGIRMGSYKVAELAKPGQFEGVQRIMGMRGAGPALALQVYLTVFGCIHTVLDRPGDEAQKLRSNILLAAGWESPELKTKTDEVLREIFSKAEDLKKVDAAAAGHPIWGAFVVPTLNLSVEFSDRDYEPLKETFKPYPPQVREMVDRIIGSLKEWVEVNRQRHAEGVEIIWKYALRSPQAIPPVVIVVGGGGSHMEPLHNGIKEKLLEYYKKQFPGMVPPTNNLIMHRLNETRDKSRL